MKSQDIRSQFLAFFETKKHQVLPSSPMVLKDDPSLMFVNSGMAPFKEFFLGHGTPLNNRITDTQKCLRVSGKHNDLEEVGYDTYHHTLFEMLGNEISPEPGSSSKKITLESVCKQSIFNVGSGDLFLIVECLLCIWIPYASWC